MKKTVLLTATSLALSGCVGTPNIFKDMQTPKFWDTAETYDEIETVDTSSLARWWERGEDETLNKLIQLALNDSPDRELALARVMEARGIARTAKSYLFPQIGASGNAGRQETSQMNADDFYDAQFDASYEIDIFGVNRLGNVAAQKQAQAYEAQYNDVTLTLIADITRSYIEYRSNQKQVAIASKNLELQTKTRDLVKRLMTLGEAPRLDVERAETLVNQTKASIPAYQRLADNARLRLTVLTGTLPEFIKPLLTEPAGIPFVDKVEPVLAAPADILSARPDIRAATLNLEASTKLAQATTRTIFPSFTIGGFYGVAENALRSATNVWSVALGAAVSVIDFGRIEGQIDAARGVEKQAYARYRKTILNAVVEVETALADYSHIHEQRISLEKAYNSASQALKLSQSLYNEGEISFLDVLDAQRTLNQADSALISAESEQAQSLIRLYKSIGVY